MSENIKNNQTQIIQVTDAAISEVKRLLGLRQSESCGIRVSVRSGGCSGLAYSIEYADDIKSYEQVVEAENIKIIIDPKAVLFLIGSTMDFIEESFKSGFVFINPNEKGKCGCGESFHI